MVNFNEPKAMRRLAWKWLSLGTMAALCWWSPPASAESPQTESRLVSPDKQADLFVQSFNAADFEKIYAQTAESFQELTSKSSFVRFLKQDIASFGKIKSFSIEEDFGDQKIYLLVFEDDGRERLLELNLGVNSAGEIAAFSLSNPPKKCPNENVPETDNPQESDLERSIHKSVMRFMCKAGVTGLSISVIDDGNSHIFNYGSAALTGGTLPTSDTIYELGSITKAFTGLLVSQAIVEQRLRLDDDILRYLPSPKSGRHYWNEPITISDLITHRSGLPSNTPSVDEENDLDPWASYSSEKLLNDLPAVRLAFSPGERFSYSNIGYGLLGLALEDIYGEPFEAVLRQKVLRPLAMSNTNLNDAPGESPQAVQPYNSAGQPVPMWTINGVEAAGGLRSTPADMAKFLVFQLAERDSAIALSHQPIPVKSMPRMAMSWGINVAPNGSQVLTHEGGTYGSSASVRISVAEKIAVAVLTNKGNAHPASLSAEIEMRIRSQSD